MDKEVFGQVINIHKLTGLAILSLMIIRLLWALSNPKPALPWDTKPWEIAAEKTVHYLLYILLFAMPISGWIMTSASEHPPHLFSWNLALPISQSKTIDDLFFNIHNALAFVVIFFVSIHILAALYHFFVKKDNVLERMMPDL